MSTLFVVQETGPDRFDPVGVYTNFYRALSAIIKVEMHGASVFGLNILKYTTDEDIQLDEFFTSDDYCTIEYPDRSVARVKFVEIDEDHEVLKTPYLLVAVSNEFIKTYPELMDIISMITSIATPLGLGVTKQATEVDDVNTVFELRKV